MPNVYRDVKEMLMKDGGASTSQGRYCYLFLLLVLDFFLLDYDSTPRIYVRDGYKPFKNFLFSFLPGVVIEEIDEEETSSLPSNGKSTVEYSVTQPVYGCESNQNGGSYGEASTVNSEALRAFKEDPETIRQDIYCFIFTQFLPVLVIKSYRCTALIF